MHFQIIEWFPENTFSREFEDAVSPSFQSILWRLLRKPIDILICIRWRWKTGAFCPFLKPQIKTSTCSYGLNLFIYFGAKFFFWHLQQQSIPVRVNVLKYPDAGCWTLIILMLLLWLDTTTSALIWSKFIFPTDKTISQTDRVFHVRSIRFVFCTNCE